MTPKAVDLRPAKPAVAAKAVPGLAGLALLLLAGCAAPDLDVGGGAWVPFSTNRNAVATDSLTVQRVRGADPEIPAVLAEPGNVWPAPEPDRPTLLGGPDEAMRNIPDYRPSVPDSGGSRPPVAGMPRGSSGSVQPLPPPPPARAVARPPAVPVAPLPPRTEGQIMIDPSGRPAIGTGGAGNVRGFTQPGSGGGAVIRDGNVETWIGPDGQARSRVVTP